MQVIDFDGNGRDGVQSTENNGNSGSLGAVNLFDDGKQQRVFFRANGLKMLRKLASGDISACFTTSGTR